MKKSLIALCMLTFVASMAVAYPGPDSMGIYAANDAVGPVAACLDLGQFQQQTLYMCLTHPTGAEILAWEARVWIENQSNIFGSWALVAGLNVGTGENFIVGLGASHLVPNAQSVVTLLTMDVLVMNDATPTSFFISGVAGSTSFPDGNPGYQAILGIMTDCVTSTGLTGGVYDIPVFVLNGCPGPVADEPAAWGQVKSLYR
jgi:hypothetical protein